MLRWLHMPTYPLAFGSWLSRLPRSTLQGDNRTLVTSPRPSVPLFFDFFDSFIQHLLGKRVLEKKKNRSV